MSLAFGAAYNNSILDLPLKLFSHFFFPVFSSLFCFSSKVNILPNISLTKNKRFSLKTKSVLFNFCQRVIHYHFTFHGECSNLSLTLNNLQNISAIINF